MKLMEKDLALQCRGAASSDRSSESQKKNDKQNTGTTQLVDVLETMSKRCMLNRELERCCPLSCSKQGI
jgi:hypothetical protein